MKKNNNFNIALYIRVANRENIIYNSNIKYQKKILINYVKKHYSNCKYKFYIDKGCSGRNFNRPNFKKMKCDIINHKIDIVICESIERLGRNSFDFLYSFIKDYNVEFVTIEKKNFIGYETFYNLVRCIQEY